MSRYNFINTKENTEPDSTDMKSIDITGFFRKESTETRDFVSKVNESAKLRRPDRVVSQPSTAKSN